jgi:hypothetical protein
MKFNHFWPSNDGVKWSRKNIFEIPSCGRPFLLIHFTSQKGVFLHQMTNSVSKMAIFPHGGISKKFYVMYTEMVNETLSQKFHPYFILC